MLFAALLARSSIGQLQGIRSFSSTAPSFFPKLKTHQTCKKRWSSMPNGMFKRAKAGKAHLNNHMTRKRLNNLGLTAYALPTQARTLRRLMPYG